MKYRVLLAIVFSVAPAVMFSQNAGVSWSTFDMGFKLSSSANDLVKSTVGQMFVGKMLSGNTLISSGFLADTLFLGTVTSALVSDMLPTEFALGQNYPNPFNPVTTIRFAVPRQSNVTIVAYNILGQIVRTLVDEDVVPGIHSVRFDAHDFSSGVYFYVMRAGKFSQARKLMLLR